MPKLICNITGFENYITDSMLKKRVESSQQTIDEYLSTYVSRKANNLLQRGYEVTEIRNLLDCKKDLPNITPEKLEKISQLYGHSSVRRLLSNFESVSSLSTNQTDEAVKSYIEFLKQSIN